jgi:hypothetical protein
MWNIAVLHWIEYSCLYESSISLLPLPTSKSKHFLFIFSDLLQNIISV